MRGNTMDKLQRLKKENNRLTKRVRHLNNSFIRIIDFSNKLNEISIEKDRKFWIYLLETAMDLIEKADYGSVYKYIDGKVQFLDAVGHDIKMLKELSIIEEVFQLSDRKNEVTIISEVINLTKKGIDQNNFEKLKEASKPIKSSITFDLFFKEKPIGGITLDIKSGNHNNFDIEDKNILNYLLNITEAFYRKDIERKFKEQKAYFQQLFDESTLAIALLDNESKIIQANKSFEKTFGYKAENVKGKNIDDLITPEEKKEEGIRNTQKNIVGEEVRLETFRKTKDGDRIFVDVHSFPIRLDKGQIGIYAIYNDISERKRTERSLRKQKAYFQQLFDESTEAIALLDNDNNILKINKSFEKLFGYKNDEVKGIDIDDLIVPVIKKKEGRKYSNQVINNKDIKKESIRKTKNDKKLFVSIHAFPIKLDEGQIGIYAIYNDITQRKKEEKKIKYLSFHDRMTGLYNRRFFESEMERLDKSRKLPISIIMSDINGLKKVNDQYGHAKGDQYIETVAKEIKKAVRQEDILARVGGDEFAILLPDTNQEEVKQIEKRIQTNVNKLDEKLHYPVGISTGYAVKKDKESKLEDVFKEADYKMYQMKCKC
jgi:diguanylate cyclase (GGDEF)-like protein/PAS domain S-box-containing protein